MGFEQMRQKLMDDQTLYDPTLVEVDPRFGPIHSIPLFTEFADRKECSSKGVHAPVFAGISGSAKEGAFSVCMSGGGYEDDKDNGETIIYTGTGGQSDSFGGSRNQVEDQSFTHPNNAALKISVETKRPVRLVRGPNDESRYAPKDVYRYDGMYNVASASMVKGKSGYLICQFVLKRVPGQKPIPTKW